MYKNKNKLNKKMIVLILVLMVFIMCSCKNESDNKVSLQQNEPTSEPKIEPTNEPINETTNETSKNDITNTTNKVTETTIELPKITNGLSDVFIKNDKLNMLTINKKGDLSLYVYKEGSSWVEHKLDYQERINEDAPKNSIMSAYEYKMCADGLVYYLGIRFDKNDSVLNCDLYSIDINNNKINKVNVDLLSFINTVQDVSERNVSYFTVTEDNL